jgi:hypothetical protein
MSWEAAFLRVNELYAPGGRTAVQFGTAPCRPPLYDRLMAIAWDLEQRQTRLDQMIEEFRVAKARRLEKQGIARANRAMTRPPVVKPDLPPAKLN